MLLGALLDAGLAAELESDLAGLGSTTSSSSAARRALPPTST
jgi:hypothetical protein